METMDVKAYYVDYLIIVQIHLYLYVLGLGVKSYTFAFV